MFICLRTTTVSDLRCRTCPSLNKISSCHIIYFLSYKNKNSLLLNPIFFFFFAYLPSPNLGLTPPGAYNPNARGSDACRGSNNLWTRTLDRYTRAGVWSAQCQGLRQRQHRTEHKGHTPNSRTEIKIPDPAGNRIRAARLEGRDSTDHPTATDSIQSYKVKLKQHLERMEPEKRQE